MPKNNDDDEMKLVTFLLSKYNKEVRPVSNKSDAVQVLFEVAYTQLLDLVNLEVETIFISFPFTFPKGKFLQKCVRDFYIAL